MFPSRAFQGIGCPTLGCLKGELCFFSHSVARLKPEERGEKSSRSGDDKNERVAKKQKTVEPFVELPLPAIKHVERRVQPFATLAQPKKPVHPLPDLLPDQASSEAIHPLASKPFLPELSPLLKPSLESKISKAHRQKVVDGFFKQFTRIYDSILSQSPTLAHIHALEQESRIHAAATKKSYTTLSVGVMTRLKARDVASSVKDIGIDGEYVARRIDLIVADVVEFLSGEQTLIDNGYPYVGLFDFPYYLKTDTLCDRCGEPFSDAECGFHSGSIIQQKSTKSGSERIHSCCMNTVPSAGCLTSKHVFKTNELSSLHHITPFVLTPEENANAHAIIALDCEMVYTTLGFEMIDVAGDMLIDVLCKTKGQVIDLNTMYSGITSLDTTEHTLETARALLFSFISSTTILVGHGLENDLQIIHGCVIDTAILFINPRGPGYKYALRHLAKLYLGKFIQTGLDGHSPLEDATTCIDLLHARLGKGFKDHRSKA